MIQHIIFKLLKCIKKFATLLYGFLLKIQQTNVSNVIVDMVSEIYKLSCSKRRCSMEWGALGEKCGKKIQSIKKSTEGRKIS